MLSITYYYREPRKTGMSIEGIFRQVRESLKGRADVNEFYCDPGVSRLTNTIHAGRASRQINHITGDVNFLALGLRGKKNVLTMHDFGHYEALKQRGIIRYTFFKLFWFVFPLKYVSIVTVVSEFTKHKLIEYLDFPENRIRVIHDPVKPVFKYFKKETLNSPLRVLMLGTGKHKNLINLIEAVKDMDVHVDIVGWPAAEELAKLKDYRISHSIYNGLSDEEVYQRYIDCDLLYFASLHEGFGMPIIEAQAVGRPVITSNLGAMKETAKGSAVLVDPMNPIETRNAILKLAEDREEYEKYVRLGLENSAGYNHEIIAGQYFDVYKELEEAK